MTATSTATKLKRGAAAGAGFALVATLVATTGTTSISASSHREAPLIAGDPRADNTDVYAFVSPDDDSTVTLIANWIPFEEPNGGPNFYPWADGARYNINVDNDGDAVADLAYTWVFQTVVKPGGDDTFLVNGGTVEGIVNDPDLLRYQTYDLFVRDLNGTPTDETDDTVTTIKTDVVAAPSISGAVSNPNYQPLVDEAVASGTVGTLKSFAGQADDPFFLDLRVFDLLYGANTVPEVGEDTLAGYNVNTIALQVPKATLALGGDATANPVIGVWSTTDRIVQTEGASTPDPADDQFAPVQVSRLGNPLVNEVVIPLSLKDAFNAIDPTVDANLPIANPAAAVQAVQFPILPPLVQAIYGQPVPGDVNNTPGDTSDDAARTDLVEIFLQGISEANDGLGGDPLQNPALNANLNDLALNAGVAAATPSEMLRLNMGVPLSANPSRLGVLGKDLQGFPNGRRLEDDVVDIELAVAEGAVYETGADVSALAPFDSVDRNDRAFLGTFPYVALPHTDSVTNGTERTPRAPEIVSINPERILDTRPGAKPAAGSTTKVNIADVKDSPIPDDAKAVYLNVTSTQAEAIGFVTVYPCDQPRPNASALNPDPARITSGLIPAIPDANGDICLYTQTATNLIVDVSAYLPSTATYTPVEPERLLDTRTGTKPAAGRVLTIPVVGVGTSQLDAKTKSVVINLTSVRSEVNGYATAYPCGEPRPVASNLNPRVGTRRSNLMTVKVGTGGAICVYTDQASDYVVDLVGAAPATSRFVATNPERLVDTRSTSRVGYSGSMPIAGQIIEVPVRGPGTNVPDDSGTVVLNVTGAGNTETGYFTVFPCGTATPTTSNLNLQDLTTAAMVVSKVGDNDRVCIYTSTSANVIVDIIGHYPGTVLPS